MAGKSFDAAVIGLGTMGTFACLELARRKLAVIGVDQFSPPHERGSHSGDTRVFRTAYAEHPDYVPIAARAGLLWDRSGAEEGSNFLHRIGMLSLGPPDSSLISGTRASAALHGLYVENLSRDQIRSRFSVFEVPVGWEGVFEPAAGWIDIGKSLRFGLERASRAGADLRLNTRVERWEWTRGEFAVITSAGSFVARRLIITAGAWASRLLEDLALPLEVVRKVMIWLHPRRPEYFGSDVFPVFASARHFFYGFPNIDGHGVKLAIHWSERANAGNVDAGQSEPTPEEVRPVVEAAAELIPSLAGPLPGAFQQILRTRTCFYTMTPDEHFLIDRHPHFENLVFAAGFSGHGFKFAPAIGEVLAQLALNETPTLRIDFLSLKRLHPAGSRG
jgi:sarcosine oxidase